MSEIDERTADATDAWMAGFRLAEALLGETTDRGEPRARLDAVARARLDAVFPTHAPDGTERAEALRALADRLRPALVPAALRALPARARTLLAPEVGGHAGRRWLATHPPRAGYRVDPSLRALVRELATRAAASPEGGRA